jgi:hypothetical protein
MGTSVTLANPTGSMLLISERDIGATPSSAILDLPQKSTLLKTVQEHHKLVIGSRT